MIRRICSLSAIVTCSLLFFVSFARLAPAAIVSYGDLTATDVMFVSIEEDSGSAATGLYGAPDSVGTNELDFDPLSFFAHASGSGASDSAGSILSFTVMSLGAPIQGIMVSETGDYGLAGLGAATATATVSATIAYTITEVNGVAVAPISSSTVLNVNPSGSLSLGSVPPAGIWTGQGTADIAALLSSGSATKVEITIENLLGANADNGGTAFIAKKDVDVMVIVPEPSSLTLLVAGLCSAVMARRRR